jgi:hypothetical protein
MTAKEVAKRIVHHLFAWVLLLGFGIAAILGGIAIIDIGYRNTLIVWSPDGAGLQNVVIFLVALCVAFGVWLIRGVGNGMWTLSTYGVLLIIVSALAGLAFGMVGIGALLVGQLALYAYARLVLKAQNRNGN